MEEFNFDTIANWLNTTEQQFQIIKTIYRLESKREEATPKNIGKEYAKTYGKSIQKPNLFTLLRTLIEKELIQKDAGFTYRVNFNGIRQSLGKHREKLDKEGEEFQKAYGKTEEYFRRNISRQERPTVDYFEQKELYAEIMKSTSNSNVLNVMTNFPEISYTYNLASGADRLEYVEAIWRRCFKEKNLEVNYLTTLDLDYLFNQAFRSLGEPKLAFKECEIVLQQLENQVEAHKKLHIKTVEEQKGMDVCIPIKDKPEEFYLFIKDEHKEVLGGIKIKSPETASQAENMFKLGFNYAEEINSKLIQKAHKKLKQEYGILE
ncbi:MAG: hypothetical protein V1703_00700 [Candidatus Altiarchaeota archaeon]